MSRVSHSLPAQNCLSFSVTPHPFSHLGSSVSEVLSHRSIPSKGCQSRLFHVISLVPSIICRIIIRGITARRIQMEGDVRFLDERAYYRKGTHMTIGRRSFASITKEPRNRYGSMDLSAVPLQSCHGSVRSILETDRSMPGRPPNWHAWCR